MNSWIRFETMFSRVFTFNPNSEVWNPRPLSSVLGALGFRGRKETDVLQPICPVSLIVKHRGFSRTKNDDEHEDKSSISVFTFKPENRSRVGSRRYADTPIRRHADTPTRSPTD